MRNFATLGALRRATAVVAGAVVITLVSASAAFAFDSPGTPLGTGNQTITWTGQGADGGVLNNSQCDAAHDPLGENQPYLLWILNMKGTVTTDATTPALTLGGSGSGTYFQSAPFTSNNVHIVTPYFDPSALTASAAMNVLTVGTGQWQLVISHGCAGTNNPPPPPPAAFPLTATKTANGTYDTKYQWDIAKAADQTQINSSDGTAEFHYKVTVHHDGGTPQNWKVNGVIDVANPNGADVAITGVTDTLSDQTPCTVDMSNGLTVPANGDTLYPYSCTLSGQPANPLNNDATVSWTDQSVAGTSGLTGGSADAVVNGISFTQDKVIDGEVSVNDTLGGDLGTVGLSGDNPKLLTYPYKFSGDPAGTCTSHDNTATFTTNTSGTTGSADATVKQCVGADLTVSKDASPSFDRTFTWTIAKSVDKTKINQVGGSATFNYAVNVGHDNGTEGNWKVKGVVTVSNPNDWEAITLNNDATGLVDAIDNGGSCTFGNDSPAGAVIPKATGQVSGQATFPYTCTYSSAPSSSSFTNTATASWDNSVATGAATPDGSASGTATGGFANPNIINGTATVTDTLHGPLGVIHYNDPSPKQFTYSNMVSVPQFNCTQVDNTATITETGQWDSKTVYVCGPAKTGALTMGYWQNKNGQAQITGAVALNLAGFLRTYNPFQDLSAAATNAQINTYVGNIIKAANASGASMNAMLRAQMLSTALDVYFNSSIGSTKIDLTKVCSNPLACTSYENDSSAFGGSPLTVNQMLAAASTAASSPNGATWYGNVKANQQSAKDAFDAINNQVAFGA